MKITKATILSYARHILSALLGAAASVSAITGKIPTAWSEADWMSLLNALWIAVIPVAMKKVNNEEPAPAAPVEEGSTNA